ncbi:MAG: isoamylase early set domain-containing protein [Candidatus Dormibacteraceae bacterium]
MTFDLPAAVEANEIALCGDFNNWSTTATKLKRAKSGSWRVTVPLQTGRSYRYRFLLDGTHWENDWSADGYVRNPYGTDDSVVNVAGGEGGEEIFRIDV